ncbi:8006_t:CDS:2 [Funneliformis mosseae]|uniref:8006_t:CDS:1 n=1 Tax=Funneliformis mosseae TaxID=27381 RepID=A0A9N8W642_FUNMO|nr:8006_t:CDS:2 [Funneliformis mosseae]
MVVSVSNTCAKHAVSEINYPRCFAKELTKEIRENANNSEWEKLRTNLVDLSNNTDNLFEIMDEHKKVSVDTLNLFEAVLRKKKLGNEVWVVVRSAINRKMKFKKMNFKKDEIEFISKLEKTLSSVKMSVEEFELLMNLKAKSNAEFHKGEDQDPKIVKRQLETTLPDELQDFKNR